MEEKRIYIAYGSNLNLPQMAQRCPGAAVLGQSAIKDYQLFFGGIGGRFFATIEPCAGKSVPVLLWSISPENELALDLYEEYPAFYYKTDMELVLEGKPVTAFVYIITPGHGLGLPGEGYYNAIVQGYDTAGFDVAILEKGLEETKAKMEKQG